MCACVCGGGVRYPCYISTISSCAEQESGGLCHAEDGIVGGQNGRTALLHSSTLCIIRRTRSGPKRPAAETRGGPLQVRLRFNEHHPWLQRDMWSTRLTLNPMVLVGNMLGSVYLVNM